MSRATFNRTYAVVEQAKKEGCRWSRSPSMIFDARGRRCSTSWASTATGSRSAWRTRWAFIARGVYNKAEYEVQRRHMMQEWPRHRRCLVEGPEVMFRRCCRQSCRLSRSILPFDWPGMAFCSHRDAVREGLASRAAQQPGVDLGEVPDDAARRQREARRGNSPRCSIS